MNEFYASDLYRAIYNNPGLALLSVVVILVSVFAVFYTYSDRFGLWLYWRFPAFWVKLPRNSRMASFIRRITGTNTAAACQLFWTMIGTPVKKSADAVNLGFDRVAENAASTGIFVVSCGMLMVVVVFALLRGVNPLELLGLAGLFAIVAIAVAILFWVLRFAALYLCPIKFKVENGESSPNN